MEKYEEYMKDQRAHMEAADNRGEHVVFYSKEILSILKAAARHGWLFMCGVFMFRGRIIPAPGGKKPTAFCYRKFPPGKTYRSKILVNPRRRMNRIGVLFSSFVVKDEHNIGIDEIACRTSTNDARIRNVEYQKYQELQIQMKTSIKCIL